MECWLATVDPGRCTGQAACFEGFSVEALEQEAMTAVEI
jgi:hypothetical protein